MDRFGIERQARISTVLNKIADRKIDLHLSFPEECESTKLAIRLPARSAGDDSVTERDQA